MTQSKKFAIDIGITFIVSLISMFLSYIIKILLGRYIRARDLGLYHLTSTIYGIAVMIAGIGILYPIIKYVAEYTKYRRKLIRSLQFVDQYPNV